MSFEDNKKPLIEKPLGKKAAAAAAVAKADAQRLKLQEAEQFYELLLTIPLPPATSNKAVETIAVIDPFNIPSLSKDVTTKAQTMSL